MEAGEEAKKLESAARTIAQTKARHRSVLLVESDPDLQWNEATGGHDFGAIDWDEFWKVVNGNGPCNKERLATRVKAWEEGAREREAALAHARKQQARAMKEAA